jgi:non-ribosomal peptide synthetase component F
MAYVMFTSGSTGRPKAAAIAQRAIVRLVRNTNYITLTVRQSGAGVERFV